MTAARTCAEFDLDLGGCRPEPLASYLKALAVVRLVAEQSDASARGFWRGDRFVLRSSLSREALLDFFSRTWTPTPVIAPWNGGSGFYPKDNREAADGILASKDSRLRAFACTIALARSYIAELRLDKRPEDDAKVAMVEAMRARVPDPALSWIDAAVVLGDERLLFPPLLGTGGNDGRLDFSNNFQQRVLEVLEVDHRAALSSSLFGEPARSQFKGAMGQFQPAANDRTNPWDFVLLMEGALVLAGSATRRLESTDASALAFPFHARAGAGLGTLTDYDEGESRDEVWLPLWSRPATMRELRRLFAEGRATVGRGGGARRVSSALDFARALTSLGTERGVDGFARIGFQVRNGLAYFATPLGRFTTQAIPSARLLDDIDAWYDRFRQKASGKTAPTAVAMARRRLEQAMFEMARSGVAAPTLLALGDAERALARSLAFATKSFLSPVPRLSSAWAPAVTDGSCEQRLAAALASRSGMRARWLPLDRSGRGFGRDDDPRRVFGDRSLIENLHGLLVREEIEELQADASPGATPSATSCSLADIAYFIDGLTNDALIDRWMRALVLIDGRVPQPTVADPLMPPATYALLSLVHHRRVGDEELPRTAGVLQRACSGDACGASMAAIRRLRSAGRPFPVRALVEAVQRTRRIAAALAFPLSMTQRHRLESLIFATRETTPSTDSQEQA